MTIAGNTVLDFGDAALMVQLGSTAEVLAWAAALRDADLPGVRDVVPAARTVLVTLDGPRYQGDVRQRLLQMRVADDEAGPADHCAELVIDHMIDIEIEVVYDGPDLPEVARLTGLTAPEVVEAHTRTPWQVGFSGFAPGFAYLVDGDPRLQVPRRLEPRTSVPAGSVGLAGEFSAIYPRSSPGGWQLIGHTDAVLWDLERPDPALLTRGMRVRFRAV